MKNVALLIEGAPISTVLRTTFAWQLCATASLTLIAGLSLGPHGALSALVGGLIIIAAGGVFGVLAARKHEKTARVTLKVLMQAEAAKIALIVAQLWLVLAFYEQLLPVPFFATFFFAVLLFIVPLVHRTNR